MKVPNDAPFVPIPAPDPGRLPGGERAAFAGWLAGVGDDVRAGEPVAELTAPGVLFDAVSPADGTLVRVNAAAGDRVTPGRPLGWVER